MFILEWIKPKQIILAEFKTQIDIKKDHEAFKHLDSVKTFWSTVGQFCPFTNTLL